MPADNLVFVVQAAFSFCTFVFCTAMLATNHNESYYLPVLTSLIGYWLPSPVSKTRLPNLGMPRQLTPDGTVTPSPETLVVDPASEEDLGVSRSRSVTSVDIPSAPASSRSPTRSHSYSRPNSDDSDDNDRGRDMV